MPFKKVRGKTDAIDRKNCTYYWPSKSNDKWPRYPGYENPFNGVIGVITGCGEQNKCPPGYQGVGEGVTGDYTEQRGEQWAHGTPYDSVIGVSDKDSSWEPIELPKFDGASRTQCGDICKKRNTKAGEDDCSCGLGRGYRHMCLRTTPFAGDWKKCCLETDANKLVKMDCSPDYFATNDGSLEVSTACQSKLADFCTKKPAYDKDNKEAPINSEYLELCGCNYPDEYYNSIRDDITKNFPNVSSAQLGHMGCFAPTCVVGANDHVKPVMKTNCPTNNFLSCINTVKIDVGGDIKGEFEVNQTNECNIFEDEGVGTSKPPEEDGTKDDNKKKKKEKKEEDDDNTFTSMYDELKSQLFTEDDDSDTNDYIMWALIIGIPLLLVCLCGLVLFIISRRNNTM